MEMKTALPKVWWWVVWGSRARVASTLTLQGVCLVRVPSAERLPARLEVFWNETEWFGRFMRRVQCADANEDSATQGMVVGGIGH